MPIEPVEKNTVYIRADGTLGGPTEGKPFHIAGFGAGEGLDLTPAEQAENLSSMFFRIENNRLIAAPIVTEINVGNGLGFIDGKMGIVPAMTQALKVLGFDVNAEAGSMADVVARDQHEGKTHELPAYLGFRLPDVQFSFSAHGAKKLKEAGVNSHVLDEFLARAQQKLADGIQVAGC